MEPSSTSSAPALPRVVGIGGAVMMGLGSIIGTGVFVTLGIATGLAGPAVILAIALAALLAAANGLSSAQLAASHPVSGGTYEYSYRYLTPSLGFTAGWMFLCAKSASAATAALGFANYLIVALNLDTAWNRPVAVAIIVILTALTLAGVRRSNRANVAIVGVTLCALVFFIIICIPPALKQGGSNLMPFFNAPTDGTSPWPPLLEATALMFVAYTGYGRIATLGEEMHKPHRNIPIAIIVTLLISMVLYVLIATVGVAAVGVSFFTGEGAGKIAPLEATATKTAGNWAGYILTLGAITALLGVLLNLLLGLSRVALAMGRRGDLPARFGQLNTQGNTPTPATLLVAAIILALVMVGHVKTTWSFSAFTVLIYYAITNLAALRLDGSARLYPHWIAMAGLIGCAGLAFWVETAVWISGLALMAIGWIWHLIRRRMQRR